MRLRRIIWFVIMIIAGLLVGVTIGWVVVPASNQESRLADLRTDYRTDLVLMSAELYANDGDLAAASARLNTLDPHTAALRQVQEAILTSQQIGYARSDIETLARLFQALQAPTPTPGAVVTASPEAQP